MIDKIFFKEQLNKNGIILDDTAIDRFDIYAKELVAYNEKVNLTAITDPEGIVIKHFLDSLMFTKYVDISGEKKLCDVGTGAGFPGMALLIANPSLKVTLFDSINKKLDFSRGLLKEFGLNAEVVTIRAEDAGRKPEYREKFDIVTARAVAQLNQLAEYCIPLCKVGGVFAPLKAPLSDEEAQRGLGAVANLGCKVIVKQKYTVADDNPREIIICEKQKPTNPKYPRNSAQISKKPL